MMAGVRGKWIVTVCAVGALLAGIFVAQWYGQPQARSQRPPSLVDLSGRPASLDNWLGKVVLVNFWATWCAPCRHEIPLLSKTFESYRELGVVIVGIALDNREAVEAYRKEVPISYPVLLIDPGDATPLMREYGDKVGALPFSAILDREGGLHSNKTGTYTEDELVDLLQRALRG